jgi:hypothetical protein
VFIAGMAQVSDQSSLDQDKPPQERDKDPDFVPPPCRESSSSAADSAAGCNVPYNRPAWTLEERANWQVQTTQFQSAHGYWPEKHHIKFFNLHQRWPDQSEMEQWSSQQQHKKGWHEAPRYWKPPLEASNQRQHASRPRSEASRPLEAAESTVPQAAESHEQGWSRTGRTWWPRPPHLVPFGDDTADCLALASVFVCGIFCGHFSLR